MSSPVATRALRRALHSSSSAGAAAKNCRSPARSAIYGTARHQLIRSHLLRSPFSCTASKQKRQKWRRSRRESLPGRRVRQSLRARVAEPSGCAGWKFCRSRRCCTLRERSRPSVSFAGKYLAARRALFERTDPARCLPVSAGTYHLKQARRQGFCV